MKYSVTYKHYTNDDEVEQAVGTLNQIEDDIGESPRKVWTKADISLIGEHTMWANDRNELEKILLSDFGVPSSSIITVVRLVDDSDELVRDSELLAIAETEPTCAHFDWSSDNVVSFARKVIAKYQEEKNLDTDRRAD